MNRIRLIAAAVAALLLVPAEPSSAQSRRDRRDRSDRGFDRSPEREAPGTQPSGAGAAAPTSESRAATMEDEFKVLLERSIFARSGTAAEASRPVRTDTAPSAPPLSPEQAVVFVGVIAQDEEYIAFAENQTTQQLMILRTGDDVARGKVVAITLDTLAYGTGGGIKEVHLGQNLAGDVVTSIASGAPTTGPAGSSSAPSNATLTPEQAALMERLKQRRLSGQ